MVPGITHPFVRITSKIVWKYVINARTGRYKLMCYIDAHEKEPPSSVDDGISGGDKALS